MEKHRICELTKRYLLVFRKKLDKQTKFLGAATLIFGVATSAAGIGGPIFMQHTIDAAAHSLTQASWAIGLVALCMLAEKTFQSISSVSAGIFIQRMNFILGDYYIKKLIQIPAAVYTSRSPQEIVQILQTAQSGNQTILSAVFATIFPLAVRFFIACSVLAITRDWAVIAMITIYTFLYAAYSASATKRLVRLFSGAMDTLIFSSRFLGDTAANITLIKVFNAWQQISNKYIEVHLNLINKWLIYYKKTVKIDIFRSLSFSTLLFICLITEIYNINCGKSSIGHLVLVSSYVIQICSPIDMILKTASNSVEALSSFRTFFNLTGSAKPYLSNKTKGTTKNNQTTSIIFKNVNFLHRQNQPILTNASFYIRGGVTFALTGPTGAGKSSIINMIIGLQPPDSGEIFINNVDLRSYTEDELYKIISYVPQETFIFNDTLAFNLKIGKPDASEEELMSVIKAVQLTELVERLPDGLNSAVGDRGMMLSGGERQRIAIARALLRDARILLIDEGTSALDDTMEAIVLRELKPRSPNHIVVMVAHRASAIAAANEVGHVANGNVTIQYVTEPN